MPKTHRSKAFESYSAFELSHKLLVELEMQVKGGLGKPLTKKEALRGYPANLLVIVTNLGSEPFPGGKFTTLKYQQPISGLENMTNDILAASRGITCESLLPGQKLSLLIPDMFTGIEGLGRLSVSIQATDRGGIEYFQSAGGSPIQNEWQNFYYVVNREQVETNQLLEKLIDLTEKVE